MKFPIAVLLLFSVLTGCNGASQDASSGGDGEASTVQTFRGKPPIRAIATVGMVADLVRQVGGEFVEVTQIMGPGVDPHLYKATRDDVQQIMRADIVFYSGLMLEGKMADTLIRIARQKPVFAVTEQLNEARLLEPEDFAGHYDPHVWMDVSAWAECVSVVAQRLSEFDPPHAAEYQASAEQYRQELGKLHEYGLKCIATIPPGSRVLITSHDAFNYFGRAYGLEVRGVQGLSTESEAGLQQVNHLVDLIVSRQVAAVFLESSVPRKNIDSLVEGARSRGQKVIIGGELFSDAMGMANTYEGTYLGMLDHNLTVVTRALGGDAPRNGMNGRLNAAPAGGLHQ